MNPILYKICGLALAYLDQMWPAVLFSGFISSCIHIVFLLTKLMISAWRALTSLFNCTYCPL